MLSRIKESFLKYKKFRYLAYHDPLTGLLNRNWLYENFENIKQPYIYFIDINNLHKINKKGHAFGDEHIKNVIDSIKHLGILVRYAGDEFLLFSYYENQIKTNNVFSVGMSKTNERMAISINNADMDMLKNKELFKKLVIPVN